MFIAMNRFKVRKGQEEDFENIWKGRDSRLQEMQGFEQFHLLRGSFNEADGYTVCLAHCLVEPRRLRRLDEVGEFPRRPPQRRLQ